MFSPSAFIQDCGEAKISSLWVLVSRASPGVQRQAAVEHVRVQGRGRSESLLDFIVCSC
jgi:hypothetical protein